MLPNEVLKGRLVQGIQRFFAIQGDPPTPQLSPEIQPGYDVANPAPDFFFLARERLCMRFFDVLGDATHQGQAQLYNPTGSGLLVVLEKIHLVFITATFDERVYLKDPNAGTLLTATTTVCANRDFRWFVSVAGAQIRSDTGAADTGGAVLGYLQTGQTHDVPMILTPGTWVTVATINNAKRISGYFTWRERPMETLEQRVP